MPTEDMELFDPLAEDSGFEWRPIEEGEGLYELILYEDPDGTHTRLFRMDPGAKTTERKAHEFYEEVYIVEGGIMDLTLDEVFTRGMYCCRTPGMEHGPYEAPVGALMFEHRYY